MSVIFPNPIIGDSQSNIIVKNEDTREMVSQSNDLPNDIWKIIFNNLNFKEWANLLFTNKNFKQLCEDSIIMLSLFNRSQCIPTTKKADFAIKLGNNLNTLILTGAPCTEHQLTKIFAACSNLKEFELGSTTLSWTSRILPAFPSTMQNACSYAASFFSEKQKALPLQQHNHLKQLTLLQSPLFSGQKLKEILTACPKLINLTLRCHILGEVLEHLPQDLESLNLKGYDIVNDSKKLLSVEPLKNLKSLTLDFQEEKTEASGYKQLYEMNASMRLVNNSISQPPISPTQKFQNLTTLHLLQSSSILINRELCIEISTAPKLTNLTLNRCKVSDEILSDLPTTLQSLDLSGCNINDDSLLFLKPLTQLSSLKLNYCKAITDVGLKHLKKLSSLNILYLIGCDQINATICESLKPIVAITSPELIGLNFNKILQPTDSAMQDLPNHIPVSRRGENH